MKSKSVKNSLTLMCLMTVLVSVIVIGGISISNISTMTSTANKNYENARLDGYNTEIKSQVQSVIAILQAEYDKSQNGDLTEDEAKKEAAEIVRNMRYRDDESGYFWIDDTDYNLIMHPILTDQEGNNRYDLTDQNGVKIIQEIKDTMLRHGAIGSLMSGSGPTVFGLFPDQETATTAYEHMRFGESSNLAKQVYLTNFYNLNQ